MDYNYVGKTLDGRYEIQEVLGVGGMAIVYRAYDNIDDRPVAVKILKEEYLANEEFRRRFKNESKAIAMLSHPNIVKVYDVSYGERLQYIVMEYVEGITLKEYIEQRRVIPWKEAVHFLTQILRALQHAHDRGVVHRDIKPQNIMLLHSGNIKVTDFGIARFSRSETRTMSENAIGSVHYISPEQARGDFTDGKTDIYSLGVVLYEMLTGELPFQSDSTVSVAIMQLQSEPRRPREINDQIPLGLEQITIHAMQKSPAGRYQSAAEMLLDLEEFKRNPLIRFEYSYYVDKEPTKYVSPAEKQRPIRAPAPVAVAAEEEDDDDEPARSRSVPIMIGVVTGILGLIALAAFIWITIGGGESIVVESFIGMKQIQIQNKMDEYGKKYDIKYESGSNGNYAPGEVYAQSPTPGSKVRRDDGIGGLVALTLHIVKPSGTKVPAVRNMKLIDAEEAIRKAELVPKSISEFNPDVAEGIVFKTDPAEGTELMINQPVLIYVGGKVQTVDMPNLLGWDVDTAKKLLEELKLSLDADVQEMDSSEAVGKIVWQSHEKGAEVTQGTKIQVKISNGITPIRSLNVDIPLPNRYDDGQLKVYLDGVLKFDERVLLSGGTRSVSLTGSGKDVPLEALLDGVKIYTATIDFGTAPPTLKNEADLRPPETTVDSRPTIPDVAGNTEETAVALLEEAGYWNFSISYVPGSFLGGLLGNTQSGTVARQTPRGGSRAEYDSAITLEVYE